MSYELPYMLAVAGAPYELPPIGAGADEIGLPSGHNLVAGICSGVDPRLLVSGLCSGMDPRLLVSGCSGLDPREVIAGLNSQADRRSRRYYAALTLHLHRCAGELLGEMPPYASSGFDLGGLFKGISREVSKVTSSVSNAAANLVKGVRQFNPAAIAQTLAIKARALAGSLKDNVVFHTLRAVADKALQPALSVIRKVGSAVSSVIPYAQAVVSFIPGVGTGISAALGAAQALADGRPITDIALAAARSAIPGGPIAKMAFDTAQGLLSGKPIDAAALGALREQVPSELGKRAFDTGLALATAKSAQDRRKALENAAVQTLASQVTSRLPAGLPKFV
jgi:hypothetical protein